MRTTSLIGGIALLGITSVLACSTNGGGFVPNSGAVGPGASGGSPSLGPIIKPPPIGYVDMSGLAATPGCGDGILTSDEACDDGNLVSGDGCLNNCLQVELGFSCVTAGEACRPIARCGDGVLVFPELCDDANKVGGDGCSPGCKIETGFKCTDAPSVCTPTVCGDGKVEGAESCEDGNARPFDGCSADCQNEPKCGNGPCTSTCGDGIVLNEQCDDGNLIDGDGCSRDCVPEPGFQCTQPDLGDTMQVPIVYRDFRYHSPTDFEPGALNQNAAVTGLVDKSLDADGKPVFVGMANTSAAPFIASKDSFSKWYRDVPGTNSTMISKLTLYKDGAGGYVNRWGANGEQWKIFSNPSEHYCGDVGKEDHDAAGIAIPCTVCYYDSDTSTPQCDPPVSTDCQKTPGMVDCVVIGTQYHGVWLLSAFDGNPTFYPVDGDNFTPTTERVAAIIPPPFGNWVPEAGAPPHNFSFTSEAGYWFKYDATKSYTLDFTGDDDVWVFINRKLAVDLGSIHVPVSGSVTLNTASAAQFGLESGKVYEIRVFQAERQTTASSYKLTLSGFSAAASDCQPVCGDGIVGIGEECDDGLNDGGYGECGTGCRLGEFCGDGIVQGGEDCDDGVNIGAPCPSGCRKLTPLL